jgi:hypothetical protein
LRLRFWGFIQQVRNVGPSAHLQALGDPLQAHGRFLAKAPQSALDAKRSGNAMERMQKEEFRVQTGHAQVSGAAV